MAKSQFKGKVQRGEAEYVDIPVVGWAIVEAEEHPVGYVLVIDDAKTDTNYDIPLTLPQLRKMLKQAEALVGKE